MTYTEFIEELRSYAEKDFAVFQRRLIFTERQIMGVRTPILRRLATKYKNCVQEFFTYPNEYYETVFIKLAIVSALPYEEFLQYVESCVALMDNWALCDSFKAKCIQKNKEKFLPVLTSMFSKGGEYEQRYPLVVLLSEYMYAEYLPTITEFLRKVDDHYYYVHMGAAWLTAEILVKFYDDGLEILKDGFLSVKTHNKAIQKAVESYRLGKEKKEYLRSLKIKN